MASVTFKNVNKVYPNGFIGAKDINLEIEDKEFLVLVGPSGCGKSTTLRMLAGLEDISDGDLLIDGNRVNDVAPKDRDIAMVFQNYALYPHMTVYENMAFGLKLRKFDKQKIDERVQEAAAILELETMLERRPKELSGGQRQRVALGRAIVRKPKVFLFDEPLSNLDAKLRGQMRAEIARLHQKLQTTIVYVTHDQVEAMTMGSRIVVMKNGIIQQVDAPISLYNNPNNKFVAGFIGSPTMNFVEGMVDNGVFTANRLQVTLSEDQKNKAGNGNYVLGIRPEDLVGSNGLPGSFTGEVDIAEPLGAETYLHLIDNSNKFIARVSPGQEYELGASLKLSFNSDKIHLFNPETEEALF